MTTTLAPPTAEQLLTVVSSHSPIAAPPGWTGTCCDDCSHYYGEWTAWPCQPLRDAADVVEVPNGWSIRPRPTAPARRNR